MLLLGVITSSFAFGLEMDMELYLSGGAALASGAFSDATRARYELLGPEEGASSSSRPAFVAGGGLAAFFPIRDRLSFRAGLDLGRWGLALSGEDEEGEDFAASEFGCLALALQADLCATFRAGPGSLRPSAGLFAALLLSDYSFEESLSGIESSISLEPASADRLFWGLGLGLSYLYRLGPGRLGLGLRGELGLSPLASGEGAVGDEVSYPLRALLRASYELHLGGGRR
ncbi:MAG TPA: hypothetical protein PLB91_16920 [Spirochaetales bacterium]|nr:hypothetical protein [Spirochaetales bacterium]